MILRFHGGPMDGLEESHGAGEPPFMLMRMPPVGEMLHAVETGDGEFPAFGATYMHERTEDGIAHYRVRALS